DGKLQVTQMKRASVLGANLHGTALWRWAPEIRSKTIAAELLGRFQVQGTTLWLMEPIGAGGALAAPLAVFALPADMAAAGVNMDDQVDKVMRAAAEREDRLPEILSQMTDFWPFFESISGIPLSRAPRTAELLAATHEWMLHLLMQLKHGFAALRPVQHFSLVMPVIPTPGHGSLPSGHATMAAYTSELLYRLLYRGVQRAWEEERADQLDRLARRIAFNRVVAGVHFPVDSMAGYALGTQMARLTAALAGSAGDQPEPLLAKAVIKAPFALDEVPKEGFVARAKANAKPSYIPSTVPTLKDLWEQAQAELTDLRV
ncbi:MAG: phosphatase PAP2 family protein, partial [Rubrivivax sp.]|nr:phosphatase PAP2 family protein [Rubrivivax sp.]